MTPDHVQSIEVRERAEHTARSALDKMALSAIARARTLVRQADERSAKTGAVKATISTKKPGSIFARVSGALAGVITWRPVGLWRVAAYTSSAALLMATGDAVNAAAIAGKALTELGRLVGL